MKGFNDYIFIFHATDENKEAIIVNFLKKNAINNFQVISDENIKSQVLSKLHICCS